MNETILPDNGRLCGIGTLPSDGLLSVCQQLSINESRLFYIGIQALKEQLRQGIWQEILLPTATIVQLFGGNKGYYDQLKKISAKLVKKKIMLDGRFYSLFDHIRFNPAGGGLFILFNKELKEMLGKAAGRQDMQSAVREVFKYRSKYTVRLLEIFRPYLENDEVSRKGRFSLVISVDSLKHALGIPRTKTYEQITNIRHKILNTSLLDINNNTDYYVTCSTIKNGRKVSAFLFSVIFEKNKINISTSNGQQA